MNTVLIAAKDLRSGFHCIDCGAVLPNKETVAHTHVREHADAGIHALLINAYHTSVRCERCGMVKGFAVPPFCGPDWMPNPPVCRDCVKHEQVGWAVAWAV